MIDAVGVVKDSLPFILSIAIQAISPAVQTVAARSLALITSPRTPVRVPHGKTTVSLGEEHIADEVKQLAISLAVFTYQQISFLLSATTTVVGLVALTISTELPWRCVFGVATVLAVILILWWYFYWQSLTFDDLHGSKGKSMQLWGWALPIIAWILTIIAQAAVGDGQPVV